MVPAEETAKASEEKQGVTVPAITLPKGGGAIHGMGEKFAANPVTGTGSMSIPIATSPGRSGFAPGLSISYDSGAGNGPFGLGWNLSLPAISRKTDKGLPRYNDTEHSDIFILSGAEDLVPVLDSDLKPVKDETSVPGFIISQYLPRIEGLFARIEHWLNKTTGESHWRTISKDNITTLYGKTENARIADPVDKTRIFSWHICESYDDKGNAIVYEYKPEDEKNIDLTNQANERNRIRDVNRYIKRIKYGNKLPRQDNEDLSQPRDWLFEVVFDYGGHYTEDTTNQKCTIDFDGNNQTWPARPDPFSSYRSGFEVRTYRLCQRVLMFHHFETELGNKNYLVKATEFHYDLSPIFSLISAVTQSSYELDTGNTFHKRSLLPLEFTYTQAKINEEVRHLDDESLRNLPEGLDGVRYQWIDLDGEGLTGILTEQADAWYYKRNIGKGRFAEQELVARKPSLAALSSGRQQLLDLAGDGQLDLVELDRPMSGFYERTVDENWEPFTPFKSIPNIAWQDPNLKFIDLTGDGHADVLISENDVFTWYGSLAEAGFGAAQRIHHALEEESGPRLVFADGTQSIYLADMSGDGLTDLVRIRNGGVCYWPNLGYGRFGAKVTMDNTPRFDYSDQFDQRRIRLADIDGSGVVDIIYLATDGINLYFNQSGNSFSPVRKLATFPKTDNISAVQVADLFGNGTACLLWSSPLPGAARSPLRYIDLMGGNKPHLLIETNNNLGGKTIVEYVASTQFYLADKLAGNPWITKLPFPVHVIAKVTVIDDWRKTKFSSTYSYHHGYFDGIEREFRGFGRVEQVDVESYDIFAKGNIASPYITDDKTLYQPPIKTITWYHTGAAIDRERILGQFSGEYFPAKYSSTFQEKPLAEPELPPDLSAEEWREALRACKGMVLRQESYELDIDALTAEVPKQIPVRIYSAATHNCNFQLLQKRGDNQHAVFLVTESEALSYYYEQALPKQPDIQVTPDPRISHTFNLRHDDHGNPQQSIVITYGRVKPSLHPELPVTDPNVLSLIDAVQAPAHIAYSEIRYTPDVILPVQNSAPPPPTMPIKHHRLRLPYEVKTYEITGITPPAGFYFDMGELRKYVFSDFPAYQPSAPESQRITPTVLQYHEQPLTNTPHQRLVEHACTLYFDDADGPDTGTPVPPNKPPLPLGQHGPRGLKYEDYKLALTKPLLQAILDDKFDPATETALNTEAKSGYWPGSKLLGAAGANQWWMRSGIAGFASDAKDHFYLPEEYTDPFGNKTTISFDSKYDLFIQSSTDALGNTSKIERFDYRVLAPSEMIDANGNHSEVVFDVLGMPVAAAIKGKEISPKSGKWQGDDLTGFDFAMRNPAPQAVQAFCTNPVMNETTAGNWLGRATTRFVYHFGDDANGDWAKRMAGACSIAREQHISQLAAGEQSKLQVSLECSDGSGNILMKKVQAEPNPMLPVAEQKLRWIINGHTVLNNKGKPVKQFEPSFSVQGFGCEMPAENGVTPIIYYDAAGRTIRTEMPDGTFSRVEFSPWHVLTFDANDTVLEQECLWYQKNGRNRYDPTQPLPLKNIRGKFIATPDERSGWLAAQHANTPALTILDSLGRDVISIAHNRTPDANGVWQDAYYTIYTKLDAEGKPLWIRDALGHLVMQYINPPKANNDPNDAMPSHVDPQSGKPIYSVPCYDIAGNLLFQHSMDAGDRWTINDAAGKPMFAWDDYKPKETETTEQKRLYSTEYDALHRPLEQWLRINTSPPVLVEAFVYCDTASPNGANNLDDAQQRNLIGQAVKHYDASGLMTVDKVDFKGAVEQLSRTLVKTYKDAVLDWNVTARADMLEDETFLQITQHDALGRMTLLYNWHRDITFDSNNQPTLTPGETNRVSVYEPQYNERGVLKAEKLHVRASKTTVNGKISFVENTAAPLNTDVITNITYNAKGQKLTLDLGNSTRTMYTYDAENFRVTGIKTERPQPPKGVQDLAYTYDPVGNITHIVDAAQAVIWHNNVRIEPSHDYVYDALYRLIEATGRENATAVSPPAGYDGPWPTGSFPSNNGVRNYTQRYEYDSVGNFILMSHAPSLGNGWTRHYQYAFDDPQQPASNRLWQTWDGSNAANKVTYLYDSHGSMLNLANVLPGQHLRWDWRDMISSIDLVGGGWAHYNYGRDKQRTRKIIERGTGNNDVNKGEVEDRIYLGGYELYRRKNSTGKVIEEIESLHVFEDDQRVLLVDDVIQSNSSRFDKLTVKEQILFRYQYSNHLGSASVELDADAQVISHEEFHPYGTCAYRLMDAAKGAPPKRYRYTGMERDEESGLGYHGERYCAPWLTRWISSDPAGLGDDLNLYSYVRCNPIRYVDLDGRVAVEIATVITEAAEGISASISSWSATIGQFSGAASGTTAPVAGATSSSAAAATVPEVAAGGLGATAIAGGLVAGALFLLMTASIIVVGAHDIQERSARYSTEAQVGHERYEKSLQQEQYRAPTTPESRALRATLLGEDRLERNAPGPDGAKGPRTFPGPVGNKGVVNLPPPPDGEKKKEAPPATPVGKGGLKVPPPESEGTFVRLAGRTAEEQAAFDEELNRFGHENIRVIVVNDVRIHHIATNKSELYTTKFKELFEGAGLTLDDERNKVSIEGHLGPHGANYNDPILKTLSDAVKGLKPHSAEYEKAFLDVLAALKKEVSRVGSDLNDLVTRK